jgi:hypothetical protein
MIRLGNAFCSCLAISAVLSGLASSTMMISYSKPLYAVRYYDFIRSLTVLISYFFVKLSLSSQTIMGRFFLSL